MWCGSWIPINPSTRFDVGNEISEKQVEPAGFFEVERMTRFRQHQQATRGEHLLQKDTWLDTRIIFIPIDHSRGDFHDLQLLFKVIDRGA